ncbi:MAG: peptide MFS transporter [Deltaproteobacteria bacterium]
MTVLASQDSTAGTPRTPGLSRPVPLTAFERRFKHPPGLVILFFAEMWERFSYYGMRGLLKLYMANYLFVTAREALQGCRQLSTPCALVPGDPNGVLFWPVLRGLLPDHPQEAASLLYGTYTALVYLTPFLGGILADRWLGQRKAVVVGGLLMAAGHFVMAIESSFFIALTLLILGNGAFKPNVSTQVGGLYAAGDPRRDGAYTIFYMGINLGAFICNLVCGTLAVVYGWHYGFAAAGFGMLLGLAVYLAGQRYLAPDQHAQTEATGQPAKVPLTSAELQRVGALVALCALNVVFWAVYEQQGNTMQSWADERTVWPQILGFQVPSTWFQSFNPLMIILLAPLLDGFWRWQQRKGAEPSSVSKMAIGCVLLGLSFIVMILGAQAIGTGKGSPFWILLCTAMLTVGELYLSPIGLSLVTKVSPARIVSMMMGIWFLSSFLGNFLSGVIGLLYTRWSPEAFFVLLTLLGVGSGIAIWLFNRPLRSAMGGDADQRAGNTSAH